MPALAAWTRPRASLSEPQERGRASSFSTAGPASCITLQRCFDDLRWLDADQLSASSPPQSVSCSLGMPPNCPPGSKPRSRGWRPRAVPPHGAVLARGAVDGLNPQRLARAVRQSRCLQHARGRFPTSCYTMSRCRCPASGPSDTAIFSSTARTQGCHHNPVLNASHLPDEITFNHLQLRVVCTVCDHRGADVRTASLTFRSQHLAARSSFFEKYSAPEFRSSKSKRRPCPPASTFLFRFFRICAYVRPSRLGRGAFRERHDT